jgi:SNF2 family DNA or RNA helicase
MKKIDWVKPNTLPSPEEFNYLFSRCIMDGLDQDGDVKLSKQRLYILQKNLENIVFRKDGTVLEEFLPPKHELVLHLAPSSLQQRLYQTFLRERLNTSQDKYSKNLWRGSNILRMILDHPYLLDPKKYEWEKAIMKEVDGISFSNFYSHRDIGNPNYSSKFQVALFLIQEARKKGDKTLVFSHYLKTLSTFFSHSR